jgi:hypothetical protein
MRAHRNVDHRFDHGRASVNAVEESMFFPLTEEEQNVVRKLSARLLSEPGIIAEAHAKLASEL